MRELRLLFSDVLEDVDVLLGVEHLAGFHSILIYTLID